MLCAIVGNSDPPNESIERPVKDWVQDTWLKGIEYLVRQGEPAHTARDSTELYDAYQHHAGLFATIYEQSRVNNYRTMHGVTTRENDLLSKIFSLDGKTTEGTAYADIIEDASATLPFIHADDFDLVFNDERIKDLPAEHQAAIARFAVAWRMIEEGYSLPGYVRVRLTRDRRLTGLPLRLDKRGKL